MATPIAEMKFTEVFNPAGPDKSEAFALTDANGAPVQLLKPYGVGIDCHSKFIQVCVLILSEDNLVRRWEGTYSTEWAKMKEAVDWVRHVIAQNAPDPFPELARVHFTLESTGCYHLPVIKAFDGVPSVVNPLLAGPSRRKTDKLDARLLAYHSITGLWPKSFLVSEEVQTARVMLLRREDAVSQRTRCSNRINNIILRYGHTIGAFYSVSSNLGRAIVEDLCRGDVPERDGVCPAGLPEAIRWQILDLYADYDRYDLRVKETEERLIAYITSINWPIPPKAGLDFISGKELFKLLQTVPGIGQNTALVWMCEVMDPRRFPNAKAAVAFCGSDPSLKVSAGKTTSTTRRGGNKRLHYALTKAAQNLVNRHKEPFGRWAYQYLKRNKKGGYKKATNALARRMAMGLYYVHMKAEPFSYDKYEITNMPDVPTLPIEDMGLAASFVTKLTALGLHDSQAVVKAYYTDLASEKGIGEKCLLAIQEWIRIMKADFQPPQTRLQEQASGKKRPESSTDPETTETPSDQESTEIPNPSMPSPTSKTRGKSRTGSSSLAALSSAENDSLSQKQLAKKQ